MVNIANKYPDFIKTTGYGTGEGACGWGCRHSLQPFAEGLRNPWRDEKGNLLDGNGNKIDDKESKKRYNLEQKQRYYERSIRSTKRKLIVKQQQIDMIEADDLKSKLQSDYDRLAASWQEKNKKYNEFCKANDLQPQYERIKVADFNREQIKAANKAATRYRKEKK